MEILTTTQVAAVLGWSDETIRKLIDDGKLHGERLPLKRSRRRVRRDDLVKFATDNGLTLDWTKIPD